MKLEIEVLEPGRHGFALDLRLEIVEVEVKSVSIWLDSQNPTQPRFNYLWEPIDGSRHMWHLGSRQFLFSTREEAEAQKRAYIEEMRESILANRSPSA